MLTFLKNARDCTSGCRNRDIYTVDKVRYLYGRFRFQITPHRNEDLTVSFMLYKQKQLIETFCVIFYLSLSLSFFT